MVHCVRILRLIGGSYRYLDDIVCLSGIDLTSMNVRRSSTIAAYDAQSFRQGGSRLIAFADGQLDWLQDHNAEPMFQAQGIPYPETTD